MKTPEEIKTKIDELLRRHSVATKKKSELSGQLQAKKEELASLVEEIKAAGFDPKNLGAERDRLMKEVEEKSADFEQKLVAVEEALNSFGDGNGDKRG